MPPFETTLQKCKVFSYIVTCFDGRSRKNFLYLSYQSKERSPVMALLEVRNIKKIYSTRFGGNKVQALSNVTFSVEKGEFVAIMGESGSGKLPFSTYWHPSTVRLPEKFSSKEKISYILQKKKSRLSEEKTLALFFRILICWIPSL